MIVNKFADIHFSFNEISNNENDNEIKLDMKGYVSLFPQNKTNYFDILVFKENVGKLNKIIQYYCRNIQYISNFKTYIYYESLLLENNNFYATSDWEIYVSLEHDYLKAQLITKSKIFNILYFKGEYQICVANKLIFKYTSPFVVLSNDKFPIENIDYFIEWVKNQSLWLEI